MKRVLVTSCNSAYFASAMTLIAGVHRTSYDVVDRVLVYDLGLTDGQKGLLGRCEKVEIVPYPDSVKDIFPGFLDPRYFAWKTFAIKDAGRWGTHVFWLDASATPVRSLATVFDLIERDGVFLVREAHAIGPWTLERALSLMGATQEERAGNMVCAGILGYKVGGRFQPLIDQAFEYAKNPEIVCGPKAVHRHDQSIYSVLAVRHRCPVHLLEIFGEFRGPDIRPDQVIYVHRKAYSNLRGIRMRWEKDLSVCVAAYNAADRIGRVLDSLEAQKGVDPRRWEVVVTDNNSTDGTDRAVGERRAGFACRLRILRETKQGLFFARRAGVSASEGSIVVFLDDDMTLDPGWLSACLAFYAAHPDAGIVGGRIVAELEGDRPPAWERIKWLFAERDYMGNEPFAFRGVSEGMGQTCGGGASMRTVAVRTAYEGERFCLMGRTGNALSSSEDLELARAILRQGWESWYTPLLVSRHHIPRSRLEPSYWLRLRAGISASCEILGGVHETEMDPPPFRYALKRFYWTACLAGRRPLLFLRRDFESRWAAAGIRGRMRGALRQLWRSSRRWLPSADDRRCGSVGRDAAAPA